MLGRNSVCKSGEVLGQVARSCESLTVFRNRLDRALSNLVLWKVTLPMAGELE